MTDRYLYCLVDTDRADPAAFAAEGVENEPVRVLATGGIGAVVHNCEGLYDAEDPTTVQAWLLDHQSVVDDATDHFGTPLPVRFDTVFQGGDGAVREWIDGARGEIEAALTRLAGCREYRIGVRWESGPFEKRMRESDDRLQEIAAAGEDASGGTEFLREKQYNERLRTLRQQRRSELETDLLALIEPVVEEWTEQESSATLGAATGGDADDREILRLAVLAAQTSEDQLGDRLDEYVSTDGVSVEFTGPWPPYSFTPQFHAADT